MKSSIKKNVATFAADVQELGGYRYTKNPPFSSVVSNLRLTIETEKIIRLLGPSIRNVVDIGCGDGTFTNELAVRLPHLSFVGFDPAKEAIEAAAARYSNCSFRVGDILDATQIPETTFDLAIIRGVIHHLPTQKQAIENALQLSRRVLIIEPNGNNPIVKLFEKLSRYHIEHEEQSFSSKFFLDIAKSLDLRVQYLRFVGFVPFFFPTVPSRIIYFFQPLLEKIPRLAKYLGGQIVILLERSEGS